MKLQRENVSLLNQELADRIKNNELKKERLEQSTRELEEQKRRLCEKRVQLSNWKDEYRKLLQSLKALQNRSPLTDNPLLYVDYEKTMQTIQQHQRFINQYKVDLSNWGLCDCVRVCVCVSDADSPKWFNVPQIDSPARPNAIQKTIFDEYMDEWDKLEISSSYFQLIHLFAPMSMSIIRCTIRLQSILYEPRILYSNV